MSNHNEEPRRSRWEQSTTNKICAGVLFIIGFIVCRLIGHAVFSIFD